MPKSYRQIINKGLCCKFSICLPFCGIKTSLLPKICPSVSSNKTVVSIQWVKVIGSRPVPVQSASELASHESASGQFFSSQFNRPLNWPPNRPQAIGF